MHKLHCSAAIAAIAALLTGCGEDQTVTVPDPAPEAANYHRIVLVPGSLSERLNPGTRSILPKEPGKNWVFDAYVSANSPSVAWSRFWTRKIDFTGVAWDTYQTVTMISPRHGLMAAHYQRPLGAPVIFHDRRGREVERAIIARETLQHDIAVVLLHEDVPDKVKSYPVLTPSNRYENSLRGTHALITDRERKVHVHDIWTISGSWLLFKKADGLAEGFYEKLIAGDSGNPSFLWVRGEPVLLGTHTTGGPGAGPFYGSPEIHEAVNAAMRRLSEANAAPVYQLRTVTP